MSNKTFCFDIDGVIATIVPDQWYEDAKPIEEMIALVNYLYGENHYIILFTARGSETHIDWTAITVDQLRDWGVKYDKLLFGKPAADYYIDDKLISVEQLKELLNE